MNKTDLIATLPEEVSAGAVLYALGDQTGCVFYGIDRARLASYLREVAKRIEEGEGAQTWQ